MKSNTEEKYSNKEISHILRSISAAYLLKNDLRFKVLAYERAAEIVEKMSREVKDIWQEGRLQDIPGIGPGIASHLDEYFRLGYSKHFETAFKGIPMSVFELMKIPFIGPKKAFRLVNALKLFNVESVIADLKKAALSERIAPLEGFGKKSEEDIVEAINLYTSKSAKTGRMPLPYAFSAAKRIMEYLMINKKVKRIDALGSLRRMVSTIGDIDIAVMAKNEDAGEIVKYFVSYPKKISVDNAGDKKASIIVHPNIRIDLRVQDEKTYGSMLQYFTGSKEHNIKLREFALKKGYSLSEYGIKELKTGKLHTFPDEKSFYSFLGLQLIPPEIREGANEIELAKKHIIPSLVKEDDIKGDLHIHSSFNIEPSHDLGLNSFKEIIDKAREYRYEYIGFSDHNPSLGNHTEKEIIEIMKKRESTINSTLSQVKNPPYYFVGIEADILPDGRLTLPEESLEYVDYVIVSVHSSFRMSSSEMTKRVIKGLGHPKVKIFGHPTGRLFGKRDEYELEWKPIFELCQKNHIALEINAWPERLDLVDTLVREAILHKVCCIINTDSHALDQMENMHYGVSVARRGWATKHDIMNTKSFDEFKKWLHS